MSQATRRFPFGWIALIVIVLIVAAVLLLPRAMKMGDNDVQTSEATLITVVTTVDSTGTVEPNQSAILYWKTTGEVAHVPVVVGDNVAAGDLLMALDPATTPPNIIGAQAELIAAQEALNNLLNPSQMTIATMESAVSDGYLAMAQVEDNLQRLIDATSGVEFELDQAVSDARTALLDSRDQFPLASSDLNAQMLYRAMRITDDANAAYQKLQDQYDSSDADQQAILLPALNAAEAAFQAAETQESELTPTIEQDVFDLLNTQSQAQAAYNETVADFIDGITGVDARVKATNLVKAESQVTLAEASLFDALQRLNSLRNAPDADELAATEARLRAAQALVDLAVLTAPFSGEVLAVYYEPGDLTTQQRPAITLADLSELHITVFVDENDVTLIEIGDRVTTTFAALPNVEIEGQISAISTMGTTVQGLVKYEVTVVLEPTDEEIPLGATADVSIEVNVEDNVLAVPVEALQRDEQGEFVNVVASTGSLQRVGVKSGAIVEGDVAVEGSLEAGDTVQMIVSNTDR